MKKILITGSGGYIGTTLTDRMLQSGYQVVGVDRYFFGEELLGPTRQNPNFISIKKDIRDLTSKDFAGVEAVCDLASLSNDPTGDLDEKLTESINHLGRLRVAQLAKKAGVKRYILSSSCSVYGAGKDGHLTEDSEPNPVTIYAKANLKAERDILPLANKKFCVTILRQATVYGLSKRMRFDLAVNLMTLNAVQKNKIFVLGGGKQWRPFVHNQDAARAFEVVLKSPTTKVNGEIFNVGSTEHNFQILSLAYFVKENIPFPVEVHVTPDDADKRNYNVDFEKISRVLGFKPEYQPSDGVREIYDALKFSKVDTGIKTITVSWYKNILEAKSILDKVSLNGRIL